MRRSTPFDPIETASRDELAALQLERMKWSIKHTYDNVVHYKKKCDAIGIRPEDLRELSDLAKFPTTSKEDLRLNYPYGMFAVPMEKIVRIHASSGTTGKPTVVGYTSEDIVTWSNVMARSIRGAGGTEHDIALVSYGYGLFTGGLGAHYGAERLGCTVIPMSGGQTEKQVQIIQDFKPTLILCTPSYMLHLADEFRRQNVDPKSCTLKLGMFGAEPWTHAMRLEIEETFGIDAIDVYGLSEVMGPGVACECIDTKDGPHIWEDHFYPEIVNPATGQPLADGESGELVFTSLTKVGMPVIRYRTRDLTRLLPGTARSMRRMDKIVGRSDDMLIIRGVNVFPTQIEELILKDARLAPHYELVVSRDGHMDTLAVRTEARPETSDDATRQAAAKQLQHDIKSLIGVSTKVDVLPPEAIKRSEGKAKRVIDNRC